MLTIHPRRFRAVPPTSRRCCMVAVASCFAQMLALINRADFARNEGQILICAFLLS